MTNEAASTETQATAVAAHGAPEKAPSKKGTSQNRNARKGQKPAKKTAKPASKKASKAAPPKDQAREGSKKQIVLDLLGRKDGATLAEIAKATNWQHHSIRGFISGTLAKKMGLTIASTKTEDGRNYRITK